MTDSPRSSSMNWLIGLASFVVIVAGLRAAQTLIVPFLIAFLLAVICAPPLAWLQRRKVPTVAALLLIVAAASAVVLVVVAVVGTSVQDFVSKAPQYAENLDQKRDDLHAWIESTFHVQLGESIIRSSDPNRGVQLLTTLLSSIGGVFSNIFMVLLMMVFMLLEASSFPKKFGSLGRTLDGENRSRVEAIRDAIWQYVSIKTGVSFLTGAGVAILTAACGVDYPLLWGLLAFCFNFVPNIGSIIAAVPAVLLAFVQHNAGTAGIVAGGFLLINMVLGNVVEPRVMGRGMGLSTLVVFLSLVFWGWVLGPVGMILSVPLTMMIKIVLESSDQTRWVALLLGSEVPDDEQKAQYVLDHVADAD